jgi:hypothetical protein
MGEHLVYIRPPDWWPEPIPEVHVFLLLKSIYGTKQAARRWHLRISEWMETNGYPAVNSEKTIFMKRDGDNFIIHGLFVDDMMHIPTCDRLWKEFLDKYTKDFDITGGDLMETFLGMQVEQLKKAVRLHLDNYIKELLDEYKAYATKSLRPKLTPIQPGLVLTQKDCPILPDARRIDRLSLKFNSLQHGFALILHIQWRNWLASVRLQVHRIGQRCIIRV